MKNADFQGNPLLQSLLLIGMGILRWQCSQYTDQQISLQCAAGADPNGHKALEDHFTDFREGRLIVPKHLLTEETTVLFVYECARKCLLLSENKCMSFNYHSQGACELMAAIEGHDYKIAVVSCQCFSGGGGARIACW